MARHGPFEPHQSRLGLRVTHPFLDWAVSGGPLPCSLGNRLAQERGECAAPAHFVRLHMKAFRPFVKLWFAKNNAALVAYLSYSIARQRCGGPIRCGKAGNGGNGRWRFHLA